MRAGKWLRDIERYTELDELLIPKDCVVLLECMSNLVANEMFREDGFHPEVAEKITEGVKNLLSQAKHVVIVTNEIFSDGILYEEESEQYKKERDRSTRNWQRWQKRLWKSCTGSLYGIKEERKHEKLWNSFKAAFAMFSKIPMPMVDWKKENIKYMMCFFPFVGTVIGILTWLAGGILGMHAALEPFFLAVILTVIPVFITGGIHVDGLLDTSDALSSWQERTRRLEILKDSHAGAFAIITACVYFILWLGAWDQLLGNYNGICIMSLGFMMSRCLSGIGVITFPKARTDGTVAEFSRNASEIAVRNVLITMFVILAALMIWVDPILGVLAAVSALLVFWWYHHMALKYFGGTTGDLSGFFLCICEVVMALVLAFGGAFNL